MSCKSDRRPSRWYYFAYGSNMGLKQMAERCPSSIFMGKGRIDGYRWQINQRVVANIVECQGDYVEGLVYEIDAKDKRQLDRSEGVGLGFYKDEHLHTLFLPLLQRGIKTFHVAKELDMDDRLDPNERQNQSSTPGRVLETTFVDKNPSRQQSSRYPTEQSLEMVEALVYVSSKYKDDDFIRSEYITRMEKAMSDGRKLGLSAHFLNHIDRIIHQERPPGHSKDLLKTNYGPYEKMETVSENSRPRQEQYERVGVRPSYPRYARVTTVRPRYQDFHDLDGRLRYSYERPYQPMYDTGGRSQTRERARDSSPTRSRQSRGGDEGASADSSTRIVTSYYIGGHVEEVIECRRRSTSTPY